MLILPLPGEMIQFDYYFSNGLKPPTSFLFECFFLSKNLSGGHVVGSHL